MFGIKKNQTFVSAADNSYNKLWTDTLDLRSKIRVAAENVIVKMGAANLYPKGVNRMFAFEDVDKAQAELVEVCDAYEQARADLKNWYEINKCDLSAYAHWNPDRWHDAAEYVEAAYRNFFKKD